MNVTRSFAAVLLLIGFQLVQLGDLVNIIFARHVRKMRRVYAECHDPILRTLINDFDEWLVPVPSVAASQRLRSPRGATLGGMLYGDNTVATR